MSVPPQIIKGKLEATNACSTIYLVKGSYPKWRCYYKYGLPEVARKKQLPLRNIYLILKQEWSKSDALCSRHINFLILISGFWRETDMTVSDIESSHLWGGDPHIISTLHAKLIESLHFKWDLHQGYPSTRLKLTKNKFSFSNTGHWCEQTSVYAVWHARKKKDSGKRGKRRILFWIPSEALGSPHHREI